MKDSKKKITQNLISNLQNIVQKKESVQNLIFNGFLGSYGFLDERVNFEKLEDKGNSFDFQKYLFIVSPKLNHEFHDEYKKAYKQYNKLQKYQTQNMEYIETLRQKMQNLKEGVRNEKIQNEKIIESKKGQTIRYGEDIFLRHYNSKMYLIAKNSYDISLKLGIIAKLSDYINKSMIFQFIPSNINQNIGDQVIFEQEVKIKNVKYQNFLFFDSSSLENFKKYSKEESQFKYCNLVQTLQINQSIVPVQFGDNYKFSWKLSLFRKLEDEENEEEIKKFQFVQLRHVDSEGMVQADKVYHDKKLVHLRNYLGKFKEEKMTVNNLWELYSDKIQGEIIQCEWNENDQSSSEVLMLRHVISGQFLSFDSKDFIIGNHNDEISKINLVSVVSNDTSIMNTRNYYIQTSDKQYLKSSDDMSQTDIFNKDNINNSNPIYHEIFEPLKYENFCQKQLKIDINEKCNIKNPFTIFTVKQEILKDFFFFQSAHYFFNIYILKMRKGVPYLFSDQKILSVINKLILYLYGQEDEEFYFYFEENFKNFEEKEPIQRRQKMCKEMGIFDMIIEIIYQQYQREQDNDFGKIDFFNQIFELFKVIIMEYRPNEMYASQWLNYIRKLALENKQDLAINNALTELIDNNDQILMTRISDEMIASFLEKLIQKEFQYFKLIKAILISNGKPIFKNQMTLTNLFFLNQSQSDILIYKMRKNNVNNEIQIKNSEINHWISLKENANLNAEQKIHVQFFQNLFEIFYDLSLGKNYKAIDYFKQIYSKDNLTTIIIEDDYSSELKIIVCKLINILWIDTFSYHLINLPNPIRIWKDFSNKNLNHQEILDNYKKTNEFDFLIKYLFQNLLEDQIDNSEYLENILILIKTLIDFGFLNELLKLKKLIDFLLNIINNYLSKNDTRPQLRKSIAIALQILEQIINYNYEIRCIKYFKKLYEVIQLSSMGISEGESFSQDFNNNSEVMLLSTEQISLNTKDDNEWTKKINNISIDEFDKLSEIFFSQSNQNHELMNLDKIMPILKQLISESDSKLAFLSFKVFLKYMTKGSQQQKFFKNVQLIFNKRNLNIYKSIKEIKEEAFKLIPSFDYIFNSKNESVDSLIYYIKKMINLLKNFQHQRKTLKPCLSDNEKNSDLVKFMNFQLTSQNYNIQMINKNLNLIDFYVVLLEYKLMNYNSKLYKENDNFIILIQLILKIMGFLMKDNSANKQYFTKKFHKSILIPLIEMKEEDPEQKILLSFFFYSILKDNKYLNVINSKLGYNIFLKLIERYQNNEQNYLEKIVFMMNVQNILNYKKKYFNVQIYNEIVNMLMKKNKQGKNEMVEEIQQIISQPITNKDLLKIDNVNHLNDTIKLFQPKLYFLVSFLQVLISVEMNFNPQCVWKTENIINLEEIEKIMVMINKNEFSEAGVFLIKNILKLLNCNFFNDQNQNKLSKPSILLGILEVLISQIKNILHVIKAEGFKNHHFFQIQKSVNFELFISDYLDQICFSMNKIFQLRYHLQKIEEYFYDMQNLDMTLIFSISNLSKNITSFMSNVNNLMKQKSTFRVKKNNMAMMNEQQILKLQKNLANEMHTQQIWMCSYFKEYNKYFQEDIYLKRCRKEDKFLIEMKSEDLIKIFKSLTFQLIRCNDIDQDLISYYLKIIKIYLEDIKNDENVSLENFEFKSDSVQQYLLFQKQKKLMSINIVPCLFKILVDIPNKNIFKQSIKVCIGLLIGGNTEISLEFNKCMKKDLKNLFMKKLVRIFKENFDLVKKISINQNDQNLDKNYEVKNIKEKLLEEKRFFESLEIQSLILSFSRLLCEGHNKVMQNYLRSQEGVIQQRYQVNLIKEITLVLIELIKFINIDCIQLGDKIFDFLIEVTQGPCINNQKFLLKLKLVENCKDLMEDYHMNILWGSMDKYDSNNNQSKFKMSNLIKKSITFLNTLLEGNNDLQFKRYIAKIFQWKFLINHLKSEFTNYYLTKYEIKQEFIMEYNYAQLIQMEKNMDFSQDLCEIFSIYFFIQIMNQDTQCFDQQIQEIKDLEKFTFGFFEENSRTVEINFHGKIEEIYFIKHPVCNFLTEQQKEVMLASVNRNTRFNKISDFQKYFNNMFDQMEKNFDMKNSSWKMIINPNFQKSLKICNIILLISITLIYFFGDYKVVRNGYSFSIFDDSSEQNHPVINKNLLQLLQYCYFLVTFLMILIWCIINVPVILMRNWNSIFLELKSKLIKKPKKTTNEIQKINILKKNMYQITQKEHYIILEHFLKPEEPFVTSYYLTNQIYNIYYVLQDSNFYVLLMYFYFAMLGATYHMIFFTFNLLIDLYLLFNDIKIIYKSFELNKAQIFFTLLLMTIIIFNYAMFGYNMIANNFFFEQIGETGENMCTTALQCFLTVFSLSARSSGCIGDILTKPSFKYENRTLFYLRYFYDVSIFLLINLLFINIFFVIIIDNFTELMEKKKQRKFEDINTCFICSLQKTFFDTISYNFEDHINKEHHVWNYLFFVYSIKVKNHTDYNGTESYIQEMIEKEDIQWFPFYQTKIISKNDDEEQLIKQIKALTLKLEYVKSPKVNKN